MTLCNTSKSLKFLLDVRKIIQIVAEFEVIGAKLNSTRISHFTHK